MVMVEMETERFLRQIKQRQSRQKACVRDGDGKRWIDWVLIWTNLQNKSVLIMKRDSELWKRASLFKLKKLKFRKGVKIYIPRQRPVKSDMLSLQI